MIDFVKFRLSSDYYDDLLQNQNLEFRVVVTTSTGEISSKQYAKFYNMKVEIWNTRRIIISGSIHKYFNLITNRFAPNQLSDSDKSKGFNGNQFSYSNICFSLSHLSISLSFDLSDTFLENVEFGFNLKHNFYTTYILNGLIRHIGKPFTNNVPNYFQAEHSQYFVKIYDKAKQYELENEILRFELKFVKMEKLNQRGIFCCKDLIDKSKIEELKKITFKAWNDVFIYDYTIDENKLNKNDRMRVLKYKNKDFWNYELKFNQQHRDKIRLKQIISEFSLNIQLEITKLMEKNYLNLISCVA
ncbi:MAG: hypothetical protein ACK48V_04170 [Crocinitomicaceae bacterium]|jgi:hypothetical protein